jgi:hypothetical protein
VDPTSIYKTIERLAFINQHDVGDASTAVPVRLWWQDSTDNVGAQTCGRPSHYSDEYRQPLDSGGGKSNFASRLLQKFQLLERTTTTPNCFGVVPSTTTLTLNSSPKGPTFLFQHLKQVFHGLVATGNYILYRAPPGNHFHTQEDSGGTRLYKPSYKKSRPLKK